MTQVGRSTRTLEIADQRTGSPRCESRFAHIALDDQAPVCLCGYVGVREATRGEAARSGYCTVCYELNYGYLPEDRPQLLLGDRR